MFLKKMLNQIVLYFKSTGIDSHGNRTYAEPIQLDGRWENDESTVLNKNGEEIISAITLHVGHQLRPGSQVYRGKRKELSEQELANPALIGLKIYDCTPLVTLRGFIIGYENNLVDRGYS